MFVPTLIAGYGLMHVVYYEILNVSKRENPLHSLLVFDLGGITHFTGREPVSGDVEPAAEWRY